jgi:hypothetical protein
MGNKHIEDKPQPIIYSSLKEWFFVQIPKNASTSIHHYLKNIPPKKLVKHAIEYCTMTDELDIYHNKPDGIIKYFPHLENFTRLCFVRNPWARCLSLYTHNLYRSSLKEHAGSDWAEGIHTRLLKEGFKGAWMEGGFFRDKENMEAPLSDVRGRNWKESDTQTSWIDEKTKIFKLEDGVDQFYDYIGIPEGTVQKHSRYDARNTTHHFNYRLYYDQELIDEVHSLYHQDIVNFGYTF